MISLVIPFHADGERMTELFPGLVEALKKFPIQEVLFAYNSRSPIDAGLAKKIQAADPRFRLVTTTKPGIGAGYKVGIAAAQAPWGLLSASDLPFGFTDLGSFLLATDRAVPEKTILLGSKSHTRSVVKRTSAVRTFLSRGLYVFRRILFGPGVPKDCQGTIFLPSALARELILRIPDDDYVFAFKLSQIALFRRIDVLEVPVVLIEDSKRSASVKPFRTSVIFLAKVLLFRWKTFFSK
jgi:hypothetical protein